MTLAQVIRGFELYCGDRAAWSRAAMNEWRALFASYGVHGETADELLAAARAKLVEVEA